MVRGLAIALFLFGAGQSVAVHAQSTQPTPRDALVTLLKDLAKVRVEYEECHGDHTSSVRDLSQMTIDLAEQHKITSAEAVDIVNDEQVFERVRTGRRCLNSGSAIKAYQLSSAAFDKAIGK